MLIDQLRKDYEKNTATLDSSVLDNAIKATASILRDNVSRKSPKQRVEIDTGEIISTDSSTHKRYVKQIYDYFSQEGLTVEFYLNPQGRYTLVFSGWANTPKPVTEKPKEPEMTEEAIALLGLLSMFTKH